MTLVRMDKLLKHARRNNYAVGAFACWDSASIRAISESAAKCNTPVIFMASPTEYEIMGGPDALTEVVKFYVKRNNIRAALHLDHGSTLKQVEECAKAGFSSVMLDASRLPFSENIKISKEAAQIANHYNATIEAELGHIGGSEGLRLPGQHTFHKEFLSLLRMNYVIRSWIKVGRKNDSGCLAAKEMFRL